MKSKRKPVALYRKPRNRSVIPTIEEILEMRSRKLFVDAPEPTDRYMRARDYCRMFFQSKMPITSKSIERGIRLGFLDGKLIKDKHTDQLGRTYYKNKYDWVLVLDSQANRDSLEKRGSWTRLHRVQIKELRKQYKPLRFQRLIDAFLEPFYEEWVSIEDMIVDDEAGLLIYPHTLFPLGFLVDYDIIEPEDLKPLRLELKKRLEKLLDDKGIDDVHISPNPYMDGHIINLQPILSLGKHVCRIEKKTSDDTLVLRWQTFGRDMTPFTYRIDLGEFMPK